MSISVVSCAPPSQSLIQKLDQLLGEYYAKHHNNYFDDDGNGKFQSFCYEKQIDDGKVTELLEHANSTQFYHTGICSQLYAFFETLCQKAEFPYFQAARKLSRQEFQVEHQCHQFLHVLVQINRLHFVPSDSELRMTFNAMETHKFIHEMDQLLADYYGSKNYVTYFDETGRGKFRSLIEDWGWNDNQCHSWMERDNFRHKLETCLFDEWFHPDDAFPCFERSQPLVSRELQRKQFAHMFLKLYRLRVVPTNDALRMSFLRESMSWLQIAQCLKHEMYTAISTKMHEVIEDIQFSKTILIEDIGDEAVMQFIDLLQAKRQLSNKEVAFIQNAVNRARDFKSGKDEPSIS